MLPFFQLPKHKVFEYQPRLYDPEKERLAQRRRELGLGTGSGDGAADEKAGTGALVRSGAMRARHDAFIQDIEDDTRKAQVRRVTIMVILTIGLYLLLNGNLDSLVSLLASAK